MSEPLSRNFLDQIPISMQRKIRRGRCIFVLGDRHQLDDFSNHLAFKSGYSKEKLSFPAVAQYYQDPSRQNLVAELSAWLRDHSSPQHEENMIARSPFRRFIDLSYGDSLEIAFQDAGRGFQRVITQKDIPYSGSDMPVIFKPFGAIQNPELLVITENDLLDFQTNKRGLISHLSSLFSTNVVVMVHCNPGNPFFRKILSTIYQRISKLRVEMLALCDPACPDEIKEAWNESSVIPVDQSLDGFLAAFPEARNITQLRKDVERSPHLRPYKFLDYYDVGDQDIFFGRERELQALYDKVHAAPLTVLLGYSGVGKTSLLRAGLIPRLQEEHSIPIYARVWRDPESAIRNALLRLLSDDDGNHLDTKAALPSLLEKTALLKESLLVIVVDQFEEIFTQLDQKKRESFVRLVNEILSLSGNPVKLILSLRDDFLPNLHSISNRLPNIYENIVILKSLDLENARQVLTTPPQLFGIQIEERLVDEVLRDLNDTGGINPAQLSIVCDRLFAPSNLPSGQDEITLQKYETLGRVQADPAGLL